MAKMADRDEGGLLIDRLRPHEVSARNAGSNGVSARRAYGRPEQPESRNPLTRASGGFFAPATDKATCLIPDSRNPKYAQSITLDSLEAAL